jgi:hypothetical protein
MKHKGNTHDRPLIQRFLEFVEIDPNSCWRWTGVTGHHRNKIHPDFHVGGKKVSASRWAYQYFNGELIKGCHVHHICRNRRCVNPDHLQLLTTKEHGKTFIHSPILVTHCKRGHVFDESNTLYETGKRGIHRHCRKCQSLSAHARYIKNNGSFIKCRYYFSVSL